MRKLIITGMAVAMLAVPSIASAAPTVGQAQAIEVGAQCGTGAGSGAFGALGDKTTVDRHDLGQGDGADWADGHLGANPLTGSNNSVVCGSANAAPPVHDSVTPAPTA